MPEHTLAEQIKNRQRIADAPDKAPETAGPAPAPKKKKKKKKAKPKPKASSSETTIAALERQIQILRDANVDPDSDLIARLRERIAEEKK